MSTRITVGELESGRVAVHYQHGTLVLTDERPGRSVLCVQVGTGKVLELRASEPVLPNTGNPVLARVLRDAGEQVVFDLRHIHQVDVEFRLVDLPPLALRVEYRGGWQVHAGPPSAPFDGPMLSVPRALLEALATGEQA